MKRIAIFTLALLFVSARATAMWVYVSTAQLAEDSDLIIVADMSQASRSEVGDFEHYEASLKIRQIVSGTAQEGETVVLKWSNQKGILCPRLTHEQHAGQTSLFLLKYGAARGEVIAPYPARAVSLAPERLVVVRAEILKDAAHASSPAAQRLLKFVEEQLERSPAAPSNSTQQLSRPGFGPAAELPRAA